MPISSRVAFGVACLFVSPALADEAAPSFKEIKQIISSRCQTCHSEETSQPGIYEAPKGIKLDTAFEITTYAPKINEQVVVARLMPLGNVTEMTEEERKKIAAWFAAGAKQ